MLKVLIFLPISCRFCGKTHERNKKKCLAFRKQCKKCGKDNHFVAKCMSKQGKGKSVDKVAETDEKYKEILSVTAECVNIVKYTTDET
jgi:adenylate kinase family enzyme